MTMFHFRPALVLFALAACSAPRAPVSTAASAPPPVAPVREDPPWLAEIAAKPLLYAIPGMDQVTASKNIVYKRAGTDVMMLDVWAPKQPTPRPAIVFVHGGPLPGNLLTQPKDWGIYLSYGRLAAASGFVGITFNHRLYGLDRLADAQSDLVDLVRHLRDNAATYGIDRDRLCLWAFSGGGTMLSAAFGDQLPGVRCLVSYYGVLDRRGQRAEIPATVTDSTLQELSPVYRVSVGHRVPPMLIARAGKDNPAINATVDAFINEAKTKRAPVQVIEHATGQHAFDALDDDARTREVIAETMRFIALQLSR